MAAARRKPTIRSVAIYTHNKPAKEKEETLFLKELLKFFEHKGVEVVHGDVRTVSLLQNKIGLVDDDEQIYDLKIGIGGDGTLLKMMRTLKKKDGLLLGINFGSLGFLSELHPHHAFEGMKKVFSGDFHIDERMLLKAFVWRKNDHGEKEKVFRAYALNEIVLGHGGLARLSNFHVRVNRRNLSTYRSDGVIFATPTGSTAYSLSVGGPIISPALQCILVTPVAPHTLTHRPIVLPPKKVMHVDFEGRTDTISMTVDGQIHFSIKPTDEVSIQTATRTARFIRMKESHYFKTLRNKMAWGEKK
ncbi:NAD(+)/NADH kinase [Candidatus Gracilibacteria bacterium]|nr:NAD(+)/NADH kinase [Candidatus Gracilibacteria bacterium]